MKGNFNENFSYLRIFVEFFRSFSNNNQEIVMQHSSVINQPDENSCEVCVCLSAMAIFESVFNDKSVVEFSAASVNDFRYSITHELCASAIQCAPLLNEAGKGTLDDGAVTGLPNLGNTCWFNATVQAIVTVIKKVNSAEIKSSAHLNDDELQSFLVQIVNSKLNVEAYLQKTILSVCKKCKFQYGAQQDAEEFYRLSNLTNILRSFETPSVLKWQMSYRCKNCNAISSDEIEEHPDLILPLETHSTGNSLKDIFDNFCDGKETKRCSNCSVTGLHSTKVLFQNAPRVLVICLGRIIHDVFIYKSSKAVSPPSTILTNAQNSTYNTYQLTSMLIHLGSRYDSGHYVTYNIISKDVIQVVDDKKSYFQQYDEAESVIEKNSYLFFYVKTATSNIAGDFSDSDSSADAAQMLLPKRFVTRHRRSNLAATSAAAQLKFFF